MKTHLPFSVFEKELERQAQAESYPGSPSSFVHDIQIVGWSDKDRNILSDFVPDKRPYRYPVVARTFPPVDILDVCPDEKLADWVSDFYKVVDIGMNILPAAGWPVVSYIYKHIKLADFLDLPAVNVPQPYLDIILALRVNDPSCQKIPGLIVKRHIRAGFQEFVPEVGSQVNSAADSDVWPGLRQLVMPVGTKGLNCVIFALLRKAKVVFDTDNGRKLALFLVLFVIGLLGETINACAQQKENHYHHPYDSLHTVSFPDALDLF